MLGGSLVYLLWCEYLLLALDRHRCQPNRKKVLNENHNKDDNNQDERVGKRGSHGKGNSNGFHRERHHTMCEKVMEAISGKVTRSGFITWFYPRFPGVLGVVKLLLTSSLISARPLAQQV